MSNNKPSLNEQSLPSKTSISIGTSTVSDIKEEKSNARDFWSQPKVQPSSYRRIPLHIELLHLAAKAHDAESILEFGCYAGRNLNAIRGLYQEEGNQLPKLQGIDINPAAVESGREAHGLDLILGGEEVLKEFPDNSIDLIFSLSVLDHVPDAEPIIKELLRICKKDFIFIEPHALDSYGLVEQVNNSLNETDRNPVMPFTYIHNYDHLLCGYDLIENLNVPTPTHLNRLGPSYRFRWFSKQTKTTLNGLLKLDSSEIKTDQTSRVSTLPTTKKNERVFSFIFDATNLALALKQQKDFETIITPKYFVHSEDSVSVTTSFQERTVDGYLSIYSNDQEVLALVSAETKNHFRDVTMSGLCKQAIIRQFLLEREINELRKQIKAMKLAK